MAHGVVSIICKCWYRYLTSLAWKCLFTSPKREDWGLYSINGEQSYCEPQRAPPYTETRHTAYRSLRAVQLLLRSSPFTWPCKGPYTPLKVPIPVGESAPHLIHCSLGPCNSASQIESWLIQPFLNSSSRKIPILYNGPLFSPQNCPLPMGDVDLHLIHGSLAHTIPQPKRHLNWFSRFCTAHYCDRLTRQMTDHTTQSVTIDRIYICITAVQPNNN